MSAKKGAANAAPLSPPSPSFKAWLKALQPAQLSEQAAFETKLNNLRRSAIAERNRRIETNRIARNARRWAKIQKAWEAAAEERAAALEEVRLITGRRIRA